MDKTLMKNRDYQKIFYHLYALVVLLTTLWIYGRTLAPTVSFYDSGELISAAYTLGVAHPPGYPLYVLLGWLFSKLPVGTVAWRINLMSACFASLASLMVYYMTYLILSWPRRQSVQHPSFAPAARNLQLVTRNSHHDPERTLYPVISMIAALTFAFSIIHWRHAVIAEVYTLNAFLSGLIMFLLLRWRAYNSSHARRDVVETVNGPSPGPLRQPFDFAQDRTQDRLSQEGKHPPVPSRGGNKGQAPLRYSWLLYLVALVFGLGFGNHQTISLFSFAACFIVLITTPRIVLNIKTLLLILVFFICGLSIYALVPIRAAQSPPINWGNAVTLRQFKWLVTREAYKHVPQGRALQTLWKELLGKEENPSHAEQAPSRPNPRTGVTGLYHIVARSLFLKQLKSFNPLREFGYMGFAFALLGLIYGVFVHRVEMLAIVIAVLSFVIVVVVIGDAPEENIFLVEEFHTPSYLLVAVCLGMGSLAIARAMLWVAPKPRFLQYGLVIGLSLYFFVLPGAQIMKNLKTVNRRKNYVAYDYANNVMRFLQPNAILFTWGDSGAFPLWYLQIVEKKRQDVTLIHMPHLGSDWYVEEIPQNLFSSNDPYRRHGGDLVSILDEIVRNNIATRPIYFDYSSSHSVMIPYPLLPFGITYKLEVPGDTLDETIWNRYSFRGILDDTRIARDPDVNRTFLMYGAAHMELGNYYLERDELEQATQKFNTAVQFEPSLGQQIVHELRFRNKLAIGNPPSQPKIAPTPSQN